MNEVEKMYRAAKVVPSHHYCNDCKYDMSAECPIRCPDDVAVYPPFTAEKQLELIKFIANSEGYPNYEFFGNLFDDYIQLLEFDEALAELVNSLWKLLSEEEKQQIKEILE